MTACTDKKLFFDKIAAQCAMMYAEKKYGDKLKVYKCPRCHYWHMATKKKAKDKHNDQVKE